MTLSDMLRLIRRQIVWLVLGGLIGLAVAFAVAMASPKTYQAHTSLYFTTRDATDAASLSQGADYIQTQIRSYPLLATAPDVLAGVSKETGIAAGELPGRVSTSVPTDSAVLDITASAERPEEAATLATAVAKHVSAEIQRVETRPGQQQSPIRATTVVAASTPSAPVAPNVPVHLIVGLAIGLLCGFLVAVARELSRRS